MEEEKKNKEDHMVRGGKLWFPKGGGNSQSETLRGFYKLYSTLQILIFQGLPQVRLGRKII